MDRKITRADRIRLAVALTALRFKLGSQSIAAYVFDLRTAFPAPSEHASHDRVWRSRLCELERKISQLEAELDAERIRSLALAGNRGDGNPASTETSGSSICLTAGHPPSLALSTGRDKKSRKKSTVVKDQGDNKVEKCYCLDLRALQNKAPSTLSTVFGTIDAFSQLVSLDMHSGLRQDTVTSTTLRSVEVIADSLHYVLMSKSTRLEHKQRVETLNSLLQYVLAHGIPLLYPVSMARKRKRKRDAGDEQYQGEPIHRLLEILRGRIFIPAIAGIYHLSYCYLSSLLCPKAGTDDVGKIDTFQKCGHFQDAPADIRRCILLFLQDNIHLLFSSISSVVTGDKSSQKTLLFNFRTSLILATIQELDTAVFNRSSEFKSSSFHPKCRDNHSLARPRFEIAEDGSTTDCTNDTGIGYKTINDCGNTVSSDFHKRVKRLATKDSVWYLCNVLHILLDGVPGSGGDAELAPNDRVGHCGVNASIQGTNSQRAGLILAKATDDAFFSFMTKCQQMMRCVGEWRLPPNHSLSGEGVHSPNHGRHDHSPIENKAPQTPFQTGSEATLHDNGLVQKVSQGDLAQEQGTIDGVTYDMILAAVERYPLRTFPREQLVG
ncbi:hypothetical protein JOM56_005799 [Amanita muscaria]